MLTAAAGAQMALSPIEHRSQAGFPAGQAIAIAGTDWQLHVDAAAMAQSSVEGNRLSLWQVCHVEINHAQVQ
jgi:hypothetical protein